LIKTKGANTGYSINSNNYSYSSNPTIMNFKAIAYAALISTVALGCSSDHQKEDDHSKSDTTMPSEHDTKELNEMRTGTGPGTGTGSASGTNTGTPGTGTGPGIHSEEEKGLSSADRNLPSGTGTETVTQKPTTEVKRGKWPTQGDPFK
jgi:hypothetical protein